MTDEEVNEVNREECLKLYEQIGEYVKFTPKLKATMAMNGDLANEPILYNVNVKLRQNWL